jgi:hypothetical protein
VVDPERPAGRRGLRAVRTGLEHHRGGRHRVLPRPDRQLQDSRHVLFVDDFPMTISGKIQKVALREEALRRLPPPSPPAAT